MSELYYYTNDDIMEIVKRIAVKCAPVYTSYEAFDKKSMTKLRHIAKSNNVKGYSTMSKQQLIEAICNAIQNGKFIENLMGFMWLDEVEEFVFAAKSKTFEWDPNSVLVVESFVEFGIIHLFNHQEKYTVVVMDEVAEIVERIYTPEFIKNKKHQLLVLDYALACVNLYGTIHIKELVEIFNSQNKRKIDDDYLINTLARELSEDGTFCFFGNDHIVLSEFADFDEDGSKIRKLFEDIEGKPRYLPPKTTLLKYADSFYFDQTIHQERFLVFLISVFNIDAKTVETTMMAINKLLRENSDINELIGYLDYVGLKFNNFDEIDTFLELAQNLHNNSRLWANKGYTPNEMISRLSKKNTNKKDTNLIQIPLNVFANRDPNKEN